MKKNADEMKAAIFVVILLFLAQIYAIVDLSLELTDTKKKLEKAIMQISDMRLPKSHP